MTINGGQLRSQVGVGRLIELKAIGAFVPEYRPLLESEFHRELLRDSIISRFFPQHRMELRAIHRDALRGTQPQPMVAESLAEYIRQRSAAFRKVVVEIYDFQCAACGLRVRIPPESLTFVDAAHLIPFSETGNDHPSNGIALCKNHHWALDRNLIAPGEDLRWHVSPRIIPNRSTGEAALAQLEGARLLPVHDKRFQPNPSALKYRHERLLA